MPSTTRRRVWFTRHTVIYVPVGPRVFLDSARLELLFLNCGKAGASLSGIDLYYCVTKRLVLLILLRVTLSI